MTTCPACSTELRDGLNFCTRCGAPQRGDIRSSSATIGGLSIFCGECGQRLAEPFKFCKACGTRSEAGLGEGDVQDHLPTARYGDDPSEATTSPMATRAVCWPRATSLGAQARDTAGRRSEPASPPTSVVGATPRRSGLHPLILGAVAILVGATLAYAFMFGWARAEREAAKPVEAVPTARVQPIEPVAQASGNTDTNSNVTNNNASPPSPTTVAAPSPATNTSPTPPAPPPAGPETPANVATPEAPEAGPAGGAVAWRGRVCGEVDVVIRRGAPLAVRPIGRGRALNVASSIHGRYVPGHSFDVNLVTFTGTAVLLQTPTAENGYTAIVRASGPLPLGRPVAFSLRWRPRS